MPISKNKLRNIIKFRVCAKFSLLRSLAISIFLSAIILPQSEAPRFEIISKSQGLSQSVVNCITQDKEGYLWIGTQDGLNKYDGRNFKIYKYDPRDSSTLSENYIWTVFEDSHGIIWVGTYGGGLNALDKTTGKFKRYKNIAENDNSLANNDVRIIYEDRNRDLWIGTIGGLHKYNRKNDNFTRHIIPTDSPPSVGHNKVRALLEDQKGNFWVGTYGGGVYIFDRAQNIFHGFQHDPKYNASLSHDKVWSIYEDRNSTIWITTWGGGINKVEHVKKNADGYRIKFKSYKNIKNDPYSLPNNDATLIYHDKEGRYWAGSDGGGISIFDYESGKFYNYMYNPLAVSCINNNSPWSIFEDRSGIIWIGTFGGGLNKYDPKKNRFKLIYFERIDPLGAAGNIVMDIKVDDKENIWIGSYGGGLIQYSLKNRAHIIYHESSGNDGPSSNFINAMCIAKDGNIWIATDGRGLNRFNPVTRKFKKYSYSPSDKNSLCGDFIKIIYEDSDGDIWIGALGGLMKYDKKNDNFIHYQNDPKEPSSLSYNNVRAISEDKHKNLWIGTINGGLNYFNKKTGKFTRYLHDPKDNSSISSNNIRYLYNDKSGALWIGTYAGGLNIFNNKTGKFSSFTEKDGLPNNSISGIIDDNDGFLWITTNYGIAKYDPRNNKFKNFDERDGLPCNEFSQASLFKSKNGELFFGTLKGIVYFSPKDISINPTPPSIQISRIKIFDKELESFDYRIDSTISLSYFDNFISFEFSALEFSIPEKNQYKYILEGFDEKWSEPQTYPVAVYKKLPPGNYRLRAIASNNDKVWSKKEASLSIIIEPPFWMTFWFKTLAALIVIGIVSLIVYTRFQKILEIERLRVRIAADLHDEIGASFTKITTAANSYQYIELSDKLKKELKKISELSGKVLGSINDAIWSIDSRNDSITNLLDRMIDLTKSLFNENKTEVIFINHIQNPKKKIKVDIRQNLYYIFKEAVNNAAKYSEADKIHIEFKDSKAEFYMKISDNGKGLPEEIRKGGNGLKNMRLRAKKINANIEMINSDGFTIIITSKGI